MHVPQAKKRCQTPHRLPTTSRHTTATLATTAVTGDPRNQAKSPAGGV
jgi:hypothetical protein